MYHSGQHVGGKRDCACVWAAGIWEYSVLSIQFCCVPKTFLKKSILKNNAKRQSYKDSREIKREEGKNKQRNKKHMNTKPIAEW